MFKQIHVFCAAVVLVLAPVAYAAGGMIEFLDASPSQRAFNIESEILAGVTWVEARGAAPKRTEIWEIKHVRYDGQVMDEYNRMANQFIAGRGPRLREDAEPYLTMAAPAGFNRAEWTRVQLTCRYYIAASYALEGKHDEAVAKYIEFIKECEANIVAANQRGRFRSAVGGKDIDNASGLHRLYLDGLMGLGRSYLKLDNPAKANSDAFVPMQALAQVLAVTPTLRRAYDWPMQAMREVAGYSEGKEDFAAARAAFEQLQTIAVSVSGRGSRAEREADLRVGFMMIREGNLSGARSRFFSPIDQWERAHRVDGLTDPQAPRPNWITPDIAYHTAGCYVGQGLVQAAEARTNADWAAAHASFSAALAIFRTDDEIRSMALLGAANATSMLAEISKAQASVASGYAKLAEKYLAELTTQFGRSKAAGDDQVEQIQKRIAAHKGE